MANVYFSLDEAEKLIPIAEKKMKRLARLNENILSLEKLKVKFNSNGLENSLVILNLHKKYHYFLHRFYSELEELTKFGMFVKDINIGLVDFYSKLGNKDIFLCYKTGEKRINYWHELSNDFAGRKPVSLLKKHYEEELKKYV